MRLQLALITSFLFFFTNCSRLPKKLSQASLQKVIYEVHNDSLIIKFSNPLSCPLRLFAISSDETTEEKLASNFPVTINPKTDTMLSYQTDKSKDEIPIRFSAIIGDPNSSIHKKDITLPFKKGNKYKVIQGYNSNYSHSSEYSKYALDFNLSEGDTVCAVADGFVVGVIEDYMRGGKLKRWRDYANYITIFHPEMNLYTQYVHLMHKGSLVEVGDVIKSEQAIGLSGKTGYTDVEHLHFNVLEPNNSGMQSTQINFEEGYRGIDLKKGDGVEKH